MLPEFQTTTDTASTKNNVLKIFALKAENTGQYKCKVTYFADGRYSLETSQVQASLIGKKKAEFVLFLYLPFISFPLPQNIAVVSFNITFLHML